MRSAGLTLFLIFILFSAAIAQDNSGLLFRSYESPIATRSSLHLSPDRPLSFEKSLSVSFKASFWRSTELGYLLRFSTPDLNQRIDLLYKPGETGEGLFKISVNGHEEGVDLHIPGELLVRNNWLDINLSIDKENEQLLLKVNDQKTTFPTTILSSEVTLNPVFGRSPYSLPSSVATPRFAIKDLQLRIDNQMYSWPLTKTPGSLLKSSEADYEIAIEYPEWVEDAHHQWQPQYTQAAKPMPGLTFDPTTNEIYIVEEGLISIYNITSRSKQEFRPKNSFPKDQGTQYALYSRLQDQLYAYDLGPEKAYAFDKETETWRNSEEGDGPPIYVWQHASFENALNGNPMIFAGYGFFTARNELLELNPQTQQWQSIPLKGDIPEPRFMLGAAEGFRSGEYFIYGGYGNESGKQDLGFDNLNDLYLLNLNDSTIKKLWGLSPGSTPYLPSTSMVLHPEDSAIYSLGYDYLNGGEQLELLKISITEPRVEVMALEEKLPFEIRNIGDYSLFLYHAKQTKELVSVLRINTDPNNAEVRIHTIAFPPFDSTIPLEADSSDIAWQYIIPGVTFIFGLLIVFIQGRANTKAKTVSEKPKAITKPQNYAVNLLGEFGIISPTGDLLTTKLSPKLKELLLLILLNTLSDKKGISSQRLTAILWPGASQASAKNNRGVSLQKLRQAIEPIATMEINFRENRWHIDFEQPHDCDLYHMLQAVERKDLDTVLTLSGRGPLLPATFYEWLDDFKINIHFKIIQFLIGSAASAKAQKDWEGLEAISRAVLNIDPVHDEALQYLLQALISSRKMGNAKSAYEQFAERYKTLYQEDYPVAFSDISQ